VVLVVLATLAGFLDARAGESLGLFVRRLLARLVMIGVIASALGLLTWAPFIVAGGLGKPSSAAHFLPEIGAYFPTPFIPNSVFGVLCLAGLVWSLVRAGEDSPAGARGAGRDAAAVLLVIAAVVYVWFALSTLAIVAHTTLLAFRFVVMADVVFAIAGVFATIDVVRWLAGVFGSARPVRTIVLVLAVAGAVSLVQSGIMASTGIVAAAESDYYPDGFNAKGEHDPTQDGAWTGELINAINQLSGRPPTDNIVLSTYERLLCFQPYWGFQQTTPHYANPLADYNLRNDKIRYWASSSDSDELHVRLVSNPRQAPNVFVLRRADEMSPGKLLMTIVSDAFPHADPLHVDQVVFDQRLFDSPRFTQRVVGPYVVVVEL
jgi:galactan 5-O-arabinofuranosyltransferase